MSLTFDALRAANVKRIPLFKNSLGQEVHNKNGSDWSDSQWLEALVGEIGEYANFHKKYMRGDITETQFVIDARKELADVQIYLDILAFRLGIDLGKATVDKFNEVSRRVGVDIKL